MLMFLWLGSFYCTNVNVCKSFAWMAVLNFQQHHDLFQDLVVKTLMNRAFLIWLSKQAGEFESVEDSGGRVAGKWKDNAKGLI